MTANRGGRWYPLSYYFAKATSWPVDTARLEFPTAQRMFDSHEDLETRIEPASVQGLDSRFEAYSVRTFTEYFNRVFAEGQWYPRYFLESDFTGFLWRERELFIGATNRDVMRGFVRTTRDRSGGAVLLQPLEADLERLASSVKSARAITLEQTLDSGLPGQITRLKAFGRDVEESEEVRHYRAGGGVGTGLEFNYSTRDWPGMPLAVTSDGCIRLLRHLGSWNSPNVAIEVQLVSDCWDNLVSGVTKVKESSAKRVKKSDRPGPVQGQKSLDELLES